MDKMKESASSRTKYASRIMLDLGLFASEDHPRTFAEIAQSQKLSPHFVSTIAVQLKRAGLIKSIRGPHGGIILARDPADLRLLEVIEAVRGPFAVMPCLARPTPNCPEIATCPVYDMWAEINQRIGAVLNDYTLADVLQKIKAKAAKAKAAKPTKAKKRPSRRSK